MPLRTKKKLRHAATHRYQENAKEYCRGKLQAIAGPRNAGWRERGTHASCALTLVNEGRKPGKGFDQGCSALELENRSGAGRAGRENRRKLQSPIG